MKKKYLRERFIASELKYKIIDDLRSKEENYRGSKINI